MKTFCNKHQEFHEQDQPCRWCEGTPAKPAVPTPMHIPVIITPLANSLPVPSAFTRGIYWTNTTPCGLLSVTPSGITAQINVWASSPAHAAQIAGPLLLAELRKT